MADDNDKTDLKVPRFDHQNKSVSRDTRIKTYIQAFKCAAAAKFGMKSSALFLPLYNTKPDETSPYLYFAKAKKVGKVAPAFLKNGGRERRGGVVQDAGLDAPVSYSRLQGVRWCHHRCT
jgi:hypothetical protein